MHRSGPRQNPGVLIAGMLGQNQLRTCDRAFASSLGPSARVNRFTHAMRLNGVDEYLEGSRPPVPDTSQMSAFTSVIWWRVSSWNTGILCNQWAGVAANDSWIHAIAAPSEGFPTTTAANTTRVYLNDEVTTGFSVSEHVNSELLNGRSIIGSWVCDVVIYDSTGATNDDRLRLYRAVENDTHFTRLTLTHTGFFGPAGTPTSLGSSNRPVTIGARGDVSAKPADDYLACDIADYAFFDVALRFEDLRFLMLKGKPADLSTHPRRTNLLQWTRQGNRAGDSASRAIDVVHNNNMTAFNTDQSNIISAYALPRDVAWSFRNDGVDNIFSSSLSFNDVLVGAYGAFSGTQNMSISAWFYVSGSDATPTTWPSTGVLFGVRNSGGAVGVRQNAISIAARAGVPTTANFSWCSSPTAINNDGLLNPAPTVNTWHHMLWVFSGSGITDSERNKLWIDGTRQTLAFVVSPPTTIASSSNNICWGSQQAGANRSPVTWHNFCIYTASLTGSHATAHYESHGLADMTTLTGSTDLVFYCPGSGSQAAGELALVRTVTSATINTRLLAVNIVAAQDILNVTPPSGVITW